MDTMRTLFKLNFRKGSRHLDCDSLLDSGTELIKKELNQNHDVMNKCMNPINSFNTNIGKTLELGENLKEVEVINSCYISTLSESLNKIDIEHYLPKENFDLKELDLVSFRRGHLDAMNSINKLNMVLDSMYKK